MTRSNHCAHSLLPVFKSRTHYLRPKGSGVMVFPNAKTNDICHCGIAITKVQHCRYLGIFIAMTHAITWTYHNDIIYSKLIKYVGKFYKVRSKLPLSVLWNIYFAFAYPHILYGIEIYGNTNSIHLKTVWIINYYVFCKTNHTNCLLKTYISILLAIPELHIQQLAILAHKFLHHRYLTTYYPMPLPIISLLTVQFIHIIPECEKICILILFLKDMAKEL